MPAIGIDPGVSLTRLIHRLAAAWALVGAAALVVVALVSVLSIAGRNLGVGPVPGDTELVALGSATAFFAGLPWCHLRRGHVTVALARRWLAPRIVAWLDAGASFLLAAVALLLAWRMFLGGVDLRVWQESTMILGIALWWLFPGIVFSLLLLAAVSFVGACKANHGSDPATTGGRDRP